MMETKIEMRRNGVLIRIEDKMNYLEEFEQFIKRVISSKYSDRWRFLFRKGTKGWAKIDIYQAWVADFSNVEKRGWDSNIKELALFLKTNGVKSYIFYGMGHNEKILEENEIDAISTSLCENIEGVYLFDNGLSLINNHNGEILIFGDKK